MLIQIQKYKWDSFLRSFYEISYYDGIQSFFNVVIHIKIQLTIMKPTGNQCSSLTLEKWWALYFIYTLRPEQDGHHFADDIFKCIFLGKKNYCISIQIMMRLIPKGPIESKWVWVQVMAWCLFSANPLLKPIVTQFTDHIYVSPVAPFTNMV